MKTALLILALVTSLPVPYAVAKDKLEPIPNEKEGRWGVYTFEEAKQEAAKKKRPLVIIVVDERSQDASVKEAGEKAFWGLAKDSTMVVILSNLLSGGKGRLGDVVFAALNSESLGKALPRLVVTTPVADVILGQLTSDQLIAADERTLKDFSKQMEAAAKNPPKSEPTVAVTTATVTAPQSQTLAPPGNSITGSVVIKDSKVESWTNVDGMTIQAALLEVDTDKVVFLKDGNRIDYPLAKLNDASRKRVDELKAAPAP